MLFTGRASSETQGLVAGTLRYFWAKVYFKSWRAPGNLLLPNQFQKWSNSVQLIGQKNIFSAQSAKTSSRVTLSPSYTKYFSSSTDCTTRRLPWRVSEKKIQRSRRKFSLLTCTRFLHCCFWLRGKLVEYPRLLIISPRSLNNF